MEWGCLLVGSNMEHVNPFFPHVLFFPPLGREEVRKREQLIKKDTIVIVEKELAMSLK